MKEKLLSILIGLVLIASLVSGCAKTSDSTTEATASINNEEVDGKADKVVVKVAASSVPHAQILEATKQAMEEAGYVLEVIEFTDYVQPNEVVEGGDFDANFFQHTPYLDKFNEEKGTHLVSVGGIHYEPLGIYPGTANDLGHIEAGAEIAVPNDTTNEARALLLLQDNGLIKLADGIGITATVNDIVDNPNNIKFVELEAAQIPRVLPEVSFAILNGNYALEAGLNVAEDALALETSDSEAAKTYVNVIVVKEGNEGNEGVKKLVEILKSNEIKEFIKNEYKGAVVAFEE